MVGRRLEEFIQSEDRARVVEVLQNALKGKETANFEFPLYSKKGERVEILLNAATRRDAHGQISGVVGVGQDITELNKGKAELARVANDLKMLIESANGARQARRNSAQFGARRNSLTPHAPPSTAPIFVIDAHGQVNEWNRKAAAITGYSTAEMLGRVLVDAEVIKTEFRTSFAEVLTLAMQGISTDNFELPLYARDGSRVELLLNATTRKDARGEVVGVAMVGQDVTGKKDIEKAQVTRANCHSWHLLLLL